MRGLHPDEGTACVYAQKKDPLVWTMLYSQASPRVLMCWLHLQRKDHQRGPCITAGITLHTYNWLRIPSKSTSVDQALQLG